MKVRTRILSAAVALAMVCSLCTPVMAAEEEGSGVTGSITATLRLDYAQKRNELLRRQVQVRLLRDGRPVGAALLGQDGGLDQVGDYPAELSARNADGGDLGDGQWPAYLELTVRDLPQGSYTLEFTGEGYVPYTQKVRLADYAQHVIVGNGDATFTLGDVNGDGKVDERDRKALSAALDSVRRADLEKYDLNGDGVVDIVDLAYVNRMMVTEGGAEVKDTLLLAPPVDTQATQAALAQQGTTLEGELSDLFADNGKGVELTVDQGDIVLPLTMTKAVETQEVQILSPAGQGGLVAGTVEVEDERGNRTTVPFDQTLPQGVHAISPRAGSSVITIDLGKRVPVKKITITVTRTETGGYAAVEAIQFLKDIVPETPAAPNSVVKGLSATAGSEMVELKWNELPNVSGYKVLYWPQKDAGKTQELHVDTTRAQVNGLENLTTYVFTVTPTDGEWEGKACDPVVATPQPVKVPDKTDMVQVTAMEGALGVSWKAGKSATYYEVYYQRKGDTAWQQAGQRLSQTRTTIGGLENDVTYCVYVVAGNDIGKGPRSDISEGTPKAVKYERPEGIPTEGILDNSLISSIALADTGNYDHSSYNGSSPFTARNMIDGDYRTHWTAACWWRNEHVVCTFARPVDLSAAIWVPRLDGSYPTNLRAYSVRVWYADDPVGSPGHLVTPDEVRGGVDNGGTGRDVDTWPGVQGNPAVSNFAVLPFSPAKGVVKISLAVEQRDYLTVSLSELMFLEYDPAHSLPGEIEALFADGLRTQLAQGVTQERIDALKARLGSDERNYYVDLNTLADELSLAQELLTTGKSKGVVLSSLDSRNSAVDGKKYSQGGSQLQPLGVTAGANQELTVYAEGIPEGESVTLYASQFNAEASTWLREIGKVENGKTILLVPKIGSRAGNNGGSLYAAYTGENGEAIRLHIRRGLDIPALELAHWYDMTESARRQAIGAYVDELGTYLSGLKMGSPTADYRNVTEISTPVVLLSLPALAVQNALGQSGREEKVDTLYNAVLAWEDIMAICKRTQGIDRVYAENDMESRQNIRCMTMFAGAFMYAAGNHIGIGYGSCGGMVTGRPIPAGGESSANGLFGWGIAHEIGHNMDKLGKAEITNNIYSIMVQTWDGKAATLPSRLEKSGKYNGIFTKVAQGYPGMSNDVFVQLGMYWQLHLAYDGEDPLAFYNAFFKAWKAGTYTAGAASYDDKVALTAAGVAGRDLTEFFTRWGMTLSAETKAKLAAYPAEDRAIWYLSDQSRRDFINGFVRSTGTLTARAEKTEDNAVTLTLDAAGISGPLQGYEILRNGKPIAFVPAGEERTASYTDVIGSANHRTYRYEAVAYDTLGNRISAADTGEVRIAYDKTVDPDKYTIAQAADGTVTIALKEETAVSGLKLQSFQPTGAEYTVTVAPAEGEGVAALSGTLDEAHNQAVDDLDSFVAYFKLPGAAQEDTRIWTYDAKMVTITGLPAGMDLDQVRLITCPGDDVAFLEGATMGLLGEDYTYDTLEGTETIPAGTLVILGTYRGDPVYNTLTVEGRFTGTQADGELTEAPAAERPVAGYALLFAQVPETGPVSDISDGLFLFVPDVQQEAALQGQASTCSVSNLLPTQIRVNLYRTDDPEDASSKRLTAQTLWIYSPGGQAEDLPSVTLEGGSQG